MGRGLYGRASGAEENLRDQASIQHVPLFAEIDAALSRLDCTGLVLRVSLSPEGEWYKPRDEPDRAWIKWLCWTLEEADGIYVTEPAHHVLHGNLNQATFTKHITETFCDVCVVVDNDMTD